MEKEKNFAIELLEKESAAYFDLNDTIWGYAEPGHREYKSSKLLADYLKENGFEVEMGISGMPTAFVATWGSGRPTIGYFAEYDATPGESQKPVPYRDPVVPHAAGFSDMHNGLGVGSVAAAIATKETMKRYGIKGTLKLFGTPAEKLCTAKCYNARDGYYDDLDVAVCWHPWMENTVTLDEGPGCYQAEVFNFYGIPSYSGRPWVGVSALDAATIMNVNVNFMREHLPPYESITVNEIVTVGGQHPTSLPEFAQVWYVSRAKTRKGIQKVQEVLHNCAEGAVKVTGAEYESRIVSSVRPWLPNHVMANVAYKNLSYVGPPRFTSEEKDFVRKIQENLGMPIMEEPLDETLTDPYGNPGLFKGGADDINEFTWHTPTCRIRTAYVFKNETEGGYGYNIPTWALAALSKTGIAHKSLLSAAKAMSCTSIELLLDNSLIRDAQEEFKERTNKYYEPVAIPDDAKPPIDLSFPPYYPEGWKTPTDIG